MIVSKPKSSPSGDGPPQEVPASQARKPTLAPADGNPGDPERSFRLERSNGTWIDLPKKFLDEIYSNARGYYAEVPHLSAALRAAAYTTLRNWDVVGTTLREKPKGRLDDYLKARKADAGAGALGAGMARASTATTFGEVEEAHRRWDEAKRSGDPDRMTRAANDLLRATERARAASGAPGTAPAQDEGRHPISEILAPRPEPDAHASALPPANELPGGDGAVRSDADVGPGEVAMGGEAAGYAVPARLNARVGPHMLIAPSSERTGVRPDSIGVEHHSTFAMANAGAARIAPNVELRTEKPFASSVGLPHADSPSFAFKSDALQGANPFVSVALSRDEERVLRAEEEYDRSTSWDWADPPAGAPYRIANLLRRTRLHRDRWREFVNPFTPDDPGRKDWANPNYGWRPNQTTLNLQEMGRRGALTVETLQMLSDMAYEEVSPGTDIPESRGMPAAFEDNPSFFSPESGWERVHAIEDSASGLRIYAIYNRRMRTLFIVNRGTRPTIGGFLTDGSTDAEIFAGRAPKSFERAHQFMLRLRKRMNKLGISNAQVIVTGHSLGGALAQFELAVAHRDSRLAGMKISGVTFAALGARSAILRHLNEQGLPTSPEDIDEFASSRLVNYVRAGDGLLYRSTLFGNRPTGIGTARELGGLRMREITELERQLAPTNERTTYHIRNLQEDPRASAEYFTWLLLTESDKHRRLALIYLLNHGLRSYYHPDFSRPLREVVPRGFFQ